MSRIPANHELRVWIISLARSASQGDWKLLDRIERRRANRFASVKNRSRFILAHASVRRILSVHIGIAPEDVQFHGGLHGKPCIEAGERAQRIQFNLSHSGNLAVLALHPNTEIGVDVERISRVPDSRAIARHYLHPDESAWLDQTSDEQHLRRFLALWTMKEACIKASGAGLSVPLDSFCVVGSNAQTEFVVHPLVLPAGYCGAVAYRPPPTRLTVAHFVFESSN